MAKQHELKQVIPIQWIDESVIIKKKMLRKSVVYICSLEKTHIGCFLQDCAKDCTKYADGI